MANRSSAAVILLIISIFTLGGVAFLIIASPGNETEYDYSTVKKLAGELADNNLYEAAIDEYKKILSDPQTDSEMRANINYLVGKIYFENLDDYKNAAAHYIKARSLNPDGSFYSEAGKNLITSLEKMGRMVDAKRELDKQVDIDSIYVEHEGETRVALIGDRPVFLSDIESEIQLLPPEVQKEFVTPEGKREFLQQYIATELLYQAAVREGYEDDPDVAEKKKALEKQLLVEKYAVENVLPKINIDTADIRNYYAANKERYGDKSYDEVKSQVFMDYQQEKAQRAFQDYIQKLSAVEKVQIFEENLK